MDTILSMRHIDKAFFGTPANKDIDLDVRAGEIHALLGENGAGKTTLMNILYGMYSRDAGEIWWKGKKVEFRSPKDAIGCRIGMVHQHFTLVSNLTVSENITLGLKSKGYPFTDRPYLNRKLKEIGDRYGLSIRPDAKISTLSVGEQQRVEIMKLLYRSAELLILDEPTAVLTPGETAEFFKVLKRLAADGCAIIIITHRIPEVMEIADRVTVLRDARKIATLERTALTEDKLSAYMIGRALNLIARTPPKKTEEAGVELAHISLEAHKRAQLTDVSLSIRPGEILGIAGVDGNGQKELAEVILGVRRHTAGRVLLCGQDVSALDVHKRKALGIGYISDDRHHDGLIMDMGLSENMLLQGDVHNGFFKKGFIDRKAVRAATKDAVEKFSIKTHALETPIRLLSGGNQQKLILSRELYAGVKLIVAFQPTRGLDIGASEFIRTQLLQYREHGCCILLISADLEEIFALSDRVAVIHTGRIMGVCDNDARVDMTQIGLMMAGRTAAALAQTEGKA